MSRLPALVFGLLLLCAMAARAETLSQEALACLALNIYWEAGQEGPEGRRAVAHVTLNRVRSPDFPDDICAVVRQGGEQPLLGCQFHWWCDGRPDRPSDPDLWQAAQREARDVAAGRSEDPTAGALFFHAAGVSPAWAAQRQLTARIGSHLFYR